jgi:asparagine synthase (glutamine-hydrolysing)
MPAASLAERRAEKDLLCTRFTPLAEIPLDRMSNEPMLPRFRWMLSRQIEWRAKRLSRFATNGSVSPLNRNMRLYDINNPGWRLVRREVESVRRQAYEFFDRAVLDELLPPPQNEIPLRGSINNVSGTKSVIGFLYWLKDHPV